MPDFTVRGIDITLAERIKEIARARNWSIDDVVLELLQKGLNAGGSPAAAAPVPEDRNDVALLSGTWGSDEAAAFRAAVEAFESLPAETPLLNR